MSEEHDPPTEYQIIGVFKLKVARAINMKTKSNSLFKKRSAGVLVHITSLPSSESFWGDNSEFRIGTIGKDAFDFVDFMMKAGLKVWQMLPVVPTDNSPYQAISVHAGNPDLISLDDLRSRGWINENDLSGAEKSLTALKEVRKRCAESFHKYIATQEGKDIKNLFEKFCIDESAWLKDFAMYCVLREKNDQKSWVDWPEDVRNRAADTLEEYSKNLKVEIDVYLFEQFSFFFQWRELKNYANSNGIILLGDMPIFVGHDSADVWAQQNYFQLDKRGKALTVAGVPPDFFPEEGQRWGNPHYAWDAMEEDGFQWWLTRLKTQLQLFDVIRVDHFRAFDAYWEIPGDSEGARQGKWVKAPGEALLKACTEKYPDLPLVAENLGLITKDVEKLRRNFKLPGMLVLQFAFDGNSDNPHLPHNHKRTDIIYTGTHDNDTTLGWYHQLSDDAKLQLKTYCLNSDAHLPWLLIKVALASVGRLAVVPMQDFLGLDSSHRMNTPGTAEDNWSWKFSWDQMESNLPERIREDLKLYQRLDKMLTEIASPS